MPRKRGKRRMGDVHASKIKAAGQAAAGWCEQEYFKGRFPDSQEDACKMGVNRTIRIMRKMGYDV